MLRFQNRHYEKIEPMKFKFKDPLRCEHKHGWHALGHKIVCNICNQILETV